MLISSVHWTSDMATDGFEAYDTGLRQKVLVMSAVLSFQANTPMHTEITSTPVPGQALHTCRMCNLKANSQRERKSPDYVFRFLGLNSDGEEVCLELKSAFEWESSNHSFL